MSAPTFQLAAGNNIVICGDHTMLGIDTAKSLAADKEIRMDLKCTAYPAWLLIKSIRRGHVRPEDIPTIRTFLQQALDSNRMAPGTRDMATAFLAEKTADLNPTKSGASAPKSQEG